MVYVYVRATVGGWVRGWVGMGCGVWIMRASAEWAQVRGLSGWDMHAARSTGLPALDPIHIS